MGVAVGVAATLCVILAGWLIELVVGDLPSAFVGAAFIIIVIALVLTEVRLGTKS